MTKVLHRHPLLSLLVAIIFCNGMIYAVMMEFHSILPFHLANYTLSAHHFLPDPRADGGPFVFLRALGQYDAQWYLEIATNGYPIRPSATPLDGISITGAPAYAFFPLYPLVIATVNTIIGNVELSAFLISNLFIILNALSLYFVIHKLYNSSLAIKTTLLLFLFPFSIFFRSYFAEGLQLFLLIWFAFFLMQKRFLPCAIFLGLLNVTKGSGMLLNVFFVVLLIQNLLSHQLKLSKSLFCLGLMAAPLSLWAAYNYIQTGNPFYFYAMQQAWDRTPAYLHLAENLWTIIHLFELPLHAFHESLINTLLAIYIFLLLILSRKHLPPILWWISFLLWFTPFVSIDLMSFSRYQIISFPLFLFVAFLARNIKIYSSVIAVFSSLLLIISLLFVNWYWIG